MKKYFPILLSKRGELTAMGHLTQNVKEEICPVIEVLPENIDDLLKHLKTHWSFTNRNAIKTNMVILDFSWYNDLSSNISRIKTFLETLLRANVNAVPAIQQDSPSTYVSMVNSLRINYNCKVCVRTSNNSGGFVNYNSIVAGLLAQVGNNPAGTILILDLGVAEANNYNLLAAFAQTTLQALNNANSYHTIVVAAGAFPDNLSMLSAQTLPHYLPRYEWDIWNIFTGATGLLSNVRYGDYGTKYPLYSNVSFAGSVSVKYTAVNRYVIYRGELAGSHAHGNGQFITHAQRLVTTSDYSGSSFSWGDSRIDEIAKQSVTDPNKKPGSLETWVQISQNHHITLLHSLL